MPTMSYTKDTLLVLNENGLRALPTTARLHGTQYQFLGYANDAETLCFMRSVKTGKVCTIKKDELHRPTRVSKISIRKMVGKT